MKTHNPGHPSRLLMYAAVTLLYFGLGEGGYGYVLLALLVLEIASGFKGSLTVFLSDLLDRD